MLPIHFGCGEESSLRLFVITDLMDRKVPVLNKRLTCEKWSESGQVSQYFVQALGEDHHDTFEYLDLSRRDAFLSAHTNRLVGQSRLSSCGTAT